MNLKVLLPFAIGSNYSANTVAAVAGVAVAFPIVMICISGGGGNSGGGVGGDGGGSGGWWW